MTTAPTGLEADHIAPEPGIDDERARRLLELNGYNAVRSELAGAFNALERVPLEAIDAAILYARKAIDRLASDPHPDADKARQAADRELELYTAMRRMRRDAKGLTERWAARDRLTVGR